jgi:WhiB family redox-sensing transcriptional regulator
MPDLLEDDELDSQELPPTGPRQEPKLSELEALRITQALAARATLEWLMVSDGRDRDLLTFSDLLRRPEWHRSAACRGVGADAFVVSKGRGPSRRQLCEECPVRQECLETAVADSDLVGLWGGTTERERRAMRRGVA